MSYHFNKALFPILPMLLMHVRSDVHTELAKSIMVSMLEAPEWLKS